MSKNVCIMCGNEFVSERQAKFCPDKPGCRQAYNRKERHIKALADQIAAATDELLAATNDINMINQATSTMLEAEKRMIARLNQMWPDRHPKKPITARPIFVDEPQAGDKLYAFDPRYPMGNMIQIGIQKVDGAWVEGSEGDNRWKTITLSRGCVFLRIIEPDTDQAGREVIAKYNPGWGAVVNPDGQIEIAAIDTPDGDEEDYSEDDEEYED
jgi:hypothetical protein